MTLTYTVKQAFHTCCLAARLDNLGISLRGATERDTVNGSINLDGTTLTIELYESDSDVEGMPHIRKLAGDLGDYTATIDAQVAAENACN